MCKLRRPVGNVRRGCGDRWVPKRAGFFLFAVAVCIFLPDGRMWAQAGEPEGRLLGVRQQDAIRRCLEGVWTATVGAEKLALELAGDGGFVLDETTGRWTVEENSLKLRSGDGAEQVYQFSLSDAELTLSGGDLSGDVKFTRQPGTGYKPQLVSRVTVKGAGSKLYRIIVVILVVVVCRVALGVFRAAMRTLIYSNWGPLKFLYRHGKNRSMTLYSLGANIAKYAIYFSALGVILTELGIDYRAYLASLSVIGLAIGFGSQGLVQDMVTGFFVIFEGQFDVGDMVEIPPYVGIVEELGLRMTRLRNYFGQEVVIPNRNIGAVGRFSRGAQQAYVDIAAPDATSARKAQPAVGDIAAETAGQFGGVILQKPEIVGVRSLATGEHFVRLSVSIWPQQQWVIEQELTARLRAGLKQRGFEIPGDKIVVFYHPRDEFTVSRWPGRNTQD